MKFLNRALEKIRHAYQNRHEPECVHVLANAYWRFLLLATALIVIGTVWYGFWQLLAITGGSEQTTPPPSASRDILDRKALQDAVNGFSERAQRYEFLKDNPPSIADPR